MFKTGDKVIVTQPYKNHAKYVNMEGFITKKEEAHIYSGKQIILGEVYHVQLSNGVTIFSQNEISHNVT